MVFGLTEFGMEEFFDGFVVAFGDVFVYLVPRGSKACRRRRCAMRAVSVSFITAVVIERLAGKCYPAVTKSNCIDYKFSMADDVTCARTEVSRRRFDVVVSRVELARVE